MCEERRMRCPRCEEIVLDEIDRNGVTIDRCSGCRGIWLDRGELEKIIARAAQETTTTAPEDDTKAASPTAAGAKRSFWRELFD